MKKTVMISTEVMGIFIIQFLLLFQEKRPIFIAFYANNSTQSMVE